MPLCCRRRDRTGRVVQLALVVSCPFLPVVTMPPLRHQRNTGRSASIRRGIATTGQIVLRLSCSVAFKNFVLAFCDVFFRPTTLGIQGITKLDVAHQAPQYLQPYLAWEPRHG
jgi:hypothetical protein